MAKKIYGREEKSDRALWGQLNLRRNIFERLGCFSTVKYQLMSLWERMWDISQKMRMRKSRIFLLFGTCVSFRKERYKYLYTPTPVRNAGMKFQPVQETKRDPTANQTYHDILQI